MLRIASIFDVSGVEAENLYPIQKAFDLIETIHGVPERPDPDPPAIRRTRMKADNGGVYDSVHIGFSGRTLGIDIGLDSPHPIYDAVHELGHTVDRHVLAYLLRLGNEQSALLAPSLKPLKEAIDESAAYQNLAQIKTLGRFYHDRFAAGIRDDQTVQGNHIYELMADATLPSELFARAYAQTILLATVDVELAADLKKYRDARTEISASFVSDDSDFEPIYIEMMNVLSSFPLK